MSKLLQAVPRDLRHDLWLTRRAAVAVRDFRKVPARWLNDVLPNADAEPITIAHRSRPRALPYGEAYILSLIAAWRRPNRIFEIGTARGDGTLLMLRQAPDARVDTLDLGASEDPKLGVQVGDAPLEASSVGEAWRGGEHETNVTQHLGDSATFDFSPFAGQIDLVFVDGAHTFEYALADSRSALGIVSKGGIIVWDDCHLYHAGVPKALLALRREGHDIVRIVGSRLALLRVVD